MGQEWKACVMNKTHEHLSLKRRLHGHPGGSCPRHWGYTTDCNPNPKERGFLNWCKIQDLLSFRGQTFLAELFQLVMVTDPGPFPEAASSNSDGLVFLSIRRGWLPQSTPTNLILRPSSSPTHHWGKKRQPSHLHKETFITLF